MQGELEAALERILGQPASLTVAGRTDAGVHAWGQVASFELDRQPPNELANRLNAVLPPEIVVIEASPAPDGFDARRDARARIYCYWVLASPVQNPFEISRALWWPHRLDPGAIEACADSDAGVGHDFTAFAPTRRSIPLRAGRGQASGGPAGGALSGRALGFWIEADAFMRHMVRVLVGTMLEVAGGRRSSDDFEELLRGAPRERAGETAPPDGLYLAAVEY